MWYVHQGDFYFGSPQGFPSWGTTYINTHLVHLFHTFKNTSFPLLEIFVVWWCYLWYWRQLCCCSELVFFCCIWLRSLKVSLKTILSWQLKNRAPSLASMADTTTNFKIEHRVWKAPFKWWAFHPVVRSPWRNVRTFCSVHLVCSNMKILNGCSWPCLMPKIAPLHWGVSPSNLGPGMLFPGCIQSTLFAHSQLY